MFLTATNVFFYLRDAGLCTAEDVVEERFAVSETGRRNRNFIVNRGIGKSLFVKQIPMHHPELIRSLLREAACAQVAHIGGVEGTLYRTMPRLLRYDPACHVLVYALIDGSENLNQHIARAGPLTAALASVFGRTLGRCHAETCKAGALADIAHVLSGEPPWILRILQQPEAIMPGISPARRRLVETLRDAPTLPDALELSSRAWSRTCLVHGDVKNDNVLLEFAAGQTELRLIDWELAELGDPAWDVASSLVSFLQPWLIGGTIAGRVPHLSEAPTSVVAASRAFWTSYREAAAASLPWARADMFRLARLVAARFALLGFELLPDAAEAPPCLADVVRLASYFAAEPSTALDQVFGLVGAGADGGPSAQPTARLLQ